MANGHAQGVRLPYAAGPAPVHRWVERELGTPVVEAVDAADGMSPGPAAAVVGADGRRAFVKACGPELYPNTPGLLREEARVLGDQRTVVVDWGQVRLGAPWMDHAMLALDCSMTGGAVTTGEFARTDPVLRDRDPDDLLAVAAAAAMSFKARSYGPPVPGLPTLVPTSGRWAEALVPYLSEALDRAGAAGD